MLLASLALSHFRNLASLDLVCPSGISVFLGENAQGKSNLLEAIYFVSTGKSFRTNKAWELVQWGRERFDIRCDVEFLGASHRVDVSVGERSYRYLWDGKPRRGASIFGNFKAVIFASEDLDVVRQEPATRRKFFDVFFSLVDPEYGNFLDEYTKVLKNRNLLLKEERFNQLEAWNELLVQKGSWLILRRKNLLAEFEGVAVEHHRCLSASKEQRTLSYKSPCGAPTQAAVAEQFWKKLWEHEEHERILKTTLSGPHRDDYDVAIGQKAVRNFGSEGQKRSAMLSLRMAQWKFLAQRFGEPPMILLDDVLGELDADRQESFLDMVVHSGAQTFIALTQLSPGLARCANAVFRVAQGTVAQADAARVPE